MPRAAYLLIPLAVLVAVALLKEPPRPLEIALFASQFEDADGQLQPLRQWQGRVLVVNFWATWCPPCREEMPELSVLQDKYRQHGVQVIGISTDDVGKMRDFSKTALVRYPLLAADFDGMRLAEHLGNNRGILPYTLVVDREGHVVYRAFGRINLPALEQQISLALKTAKPNRSKIPELRQTSAKVLDNRRQFAANWRSDHRHPSTRIKIWL